MKTRGRSDLFLGSLCHPASQVILYFCNVTPTFSLPLNVRLHSYELSFFFFLYFSVDLKTKTAVQQDLLLRGRPSLVLRPPCREEKKLLI